MDSTINETPLISVLMPVYNCELYVKEAIESILNQTHSNFEFLIIDDASTDQTLSIIKTFIDPRIMLIEKPVNTGLTNSLNLGLKLAKGKYIARMDGDDISLPHRFAKQITFLDNNTDYVLCGSILKILNTNRDYNLPENHKAIKLAMLERCPIAHPTVMMRKSILDRYSFFYNPSKEPAEDYDFWIRLITKGKFYNIQEVLLYYRLHNFQISYLRLAEQKNKSAEAKLDLLCNLNLIILANEQDVLKKIFVGGKRINFQDIQNFSSVKNKLEISNTNLFFEEKGFDKFLLNLENDALVNFFSKTGRYSPLDFFRYCRINKKFNLHFKYFDIIKLFLKSFSFYKYKKKTGIF